MKPVNSTIYRKLLKEGKIPKNTIINGREVYLKDKRWLYKDTNQFALNPFILRCETDNCNGLVRNSGKHCSKHIDWSKTSHGASLLTDEDVNFLSANVNKMSDYEITDKLLKLKRHNNTTRKALVIALRHHRRKYLNKRYTGKYFYISIKLKYKEEHTKCEICGWCDGMVDLHHILQTKDFTDELDYHKHENMICLCPNHHRVVEELRAINMSKYLKYIRNFKINLVV